MNHFKHTILAFRTKKKQNFLAIALILGSISLAGCQFDKVDPFKQEVSLALEHFYQGQRLQQQQDYQAARQEYLASIQVSPRPIAYYRLAEIAIAMNDIEQAQAYLDQALALNPQFQQARQVKSQIQSRLSEPGSISQTNTPEPTQPAAEQPTATPVIDIAEEEIEQAAPTKTPTPLVPLRQDESVENGTEEPAETTTSQSTEQPSTTAPANQTSPPEAEQPPGSKEVAEEHLPLFDQLAQAEQAGNWSEAASIAMELNKLYPGRADVLYHLGYTTYQLGLPEEAAGYFEQSVEADPSNAAAWNDLGVVLENLGRHREAGQAYQKAVEIGTSPDAFFNLAQFFEKQGNYRQAIELYQAYLEFDENSQYAQHAKQQIEKLRRFVY